MRNAEEERRSISASTEATEIIYVTYQTLRIEVNIPFMLFFDNIFFFAIQHKSPVCSNKFSFPIDLAGAPVESFYET